MKRAFFPLIVAGAFAASAQVDVDITIPEQQRPIASDRKPGNDLLNQGPKLEDLPPAVIQRVKQYPFQIADIDQETWQGKPAYEIEFKTEGINKRIHVGADGQLLKDTRKEGDTMWGLFLGTQLTDLPPAAQQTIQKQIAPKGVIVDIDRVNWTGDKVYEVTYKQQTGGEKKFQVAESGTVVNEAAGAKANIGDGPNADLTKGQGADGRLNVELGNDPDLSSLPPAVQSAAKNADNGKIVDIDIKDQDGKKVYEVDFQREGINRRIEFNADGSIIKDNKRD